MNQYKNNNNIIDTDREDLKDNVSTIKIFAFIVSGIIVLLFVFVILSSVFRRRPCAVNHRCINNLKRYGDALDQYAADKQQYPSSLIMLMPQYMKYPEKCERYEYAYEVDSQFQNYTISCTGDHSRKENPSISSIYGLMEYGISSRTWERDIILQFGRDPKEALRRAQENYESGDNKDIMILAGSVNITDKFGYSPLHYAAVHNETTFAELILSLGADVNIQDKRSNTPLHYAAIHNNPEMVKLFLDQNAHTGLTNFKGNTPLMENLYYRIQEENKPSKHKAKHKMSQDRKEQQEPLEWEDIIKREVENKQSIKEMLEKADMERHNSEELVK